MKITAKILILFLFLTCYASTVQAAEEFHLWVESGFSYKINKQWSFALEQNLKFNDNVTNVDTINHQISLRYRITDFLRLSGGYRFIVEPLSNVTTAYINYWHRFYGDARFSFSAKRVSFIYRLRYQEQFGDERQLTGREFKMKHTIRNKLELEFDLPKKFTAFTYGELFARIADNDGVMHKWRAALGVEYSYKKHDFSLYYMREQMLNGTVIPHANVLGVGYSYAFR
ncbi:MAG: DUF2490 domain-containing protein [bacterium]|nr:DUF2490 domain-containing protein [bacterium]